MDSNFVLLSNHNFISIIQTKIAFYTEAIIFYNTLKELFTAYKTEVGRKASRNLKACGAALLRDKSQHLSFNVPGKYFLDHNWSWLVLKSKIPKIFILPLQFHLTKNDPLFKWL